MRKRLPEIDDIRGIAIIVMILIHTNAYFLTVPIAYMSREISQFAVVAFLFCSAYLTIQKPYPASKGELMSYFYKRLKRLLIPFYAFFVAYVVFMNVAAKAKLSQDYIMQSFLLTGGIDFNWLVLLFVQLMFVTPLLQYLYDKRKNLLYAYTALALASSVLFLKFTPLPYYRALMWLPWSLVIIYVMHFENLWKNKWLFFWTTFLTGALFLATRQLLLSPLHRSLTMYDNKYPPNLYHISYSLFAVNILYFLSRSKVFALRFVQGIIHYFSINSYSIFFIHILVIEAVWRLIRPNSWILFFLLVTYGSVLIQNLLTWTGKKLKKPVKK